MNYRKEIRRIDSELEQSFPNFPIGRHLALAFEGEDTAALSDKQYYTILQKYQHELEFGGAISDTFESDIIEDASHLFDEQIED